MGRKDTELDVVKAVQEQTEQAAALAAIDGQARLADPRLNPAVRGHADRLRDGQQVKALDAEDSRKRRALRVADARAAEAERTLEAVALAKRASSPARSVLALHTGRRVYARLSTAASVVLAAGSAMGVEEAARALGAPAGSGYIAEVGLTGLSTVAITYRAHLAEHRGDLKKGSWQSRSLWALMVVPLLVSVTANLAKTNVIGAACAIGAASFALLACVIADRSSAAMADRAAEVSDDAEDELRSVAMGEDLFAPVTQGSASPGHEHQDEPGDVAEDERAADQHDDGLDVGQEARAGVDELAAWLADQDPPDEGAAPPAPSPGGTGPNGAAAEVGRREQDEHEHGDGAVETTDRPTIRPGVGIDADQGRVQDGRDGRPERVLPAIEARLAVGASTRSRVAEYLAANPKATNAQVAAALELGRTTVKTHRRELRRMQQRATQQAEAHGGDQ